MKDIVHKLHKDMAEKLDCELVVIGKDAFIAKNSNEVSRNRKKFKYILAEGNWGFNDKRIDIIFNLEKSKRKDFLHHRASDMNQVLAKQAAAGDIAIGFNFNLLLGENKDVVLGRMQQNVRLCRKYKVKMIIATFAEKPLQMRNSKDLQAVGVVLGMHPKEAKEALDW